MKILFTDDQEYDDENSSENIIVILVGHQGVYKSALDEILYNSNKFTHISIRDKDNRKDIKGIYPISQIKRIIP